MYSDITKEKLRKLPAVHEMIAQLSSLTEIANSNHDSLTWAVRTALKKARHKIIEAEYQEQNEGINESEKSFQWHSTGDEFRQKLNIWLEEEIAGLLQGLQTSLRRVVNATGVVLHTNCGRAVIAAEVADLLAEQARSYSNLELNLETGNRGSRYVHVEDLLLKLTGAEAALVVNNNAAAVLLIMNTFAQEKEVIVSRGELVEVGGSFRIPEVLRAGGAKLIEVGSTNRTWLEDYREKITEQTALLLKVHTSNYRIKGFHHEVSAKELAALGQEYGIPTVEDLGSGTFLSGEELGLPKEPTISEAISAGVQLLTFSGDKLLGGPQAGIIVGQKKMIEQLKQNQLTRAIRVDKFTLTALEGTLRLYERGEIEKIPVWRMLKMSEEEVLQKAQSLQVKLENDVCLTAEVISDVSRVGGGAFPTAEIPTYACALKPLKGSAIELEAFLRRGEIPILTRISQDRVLLDPRTLFEQDFELIVQRLQQWQNKFAVQGE